MKRMKSEASSARDPWIVRAGRWLTKRRSVLLTPLFTTALFSARMAVTPWIELGQDVVGLICLMAGTRLRLVAASYHESSHRSEPITAGPYAWVRHPLYAANFLLGLGIVLLAGWWPMMVGYCLFFIPLHLVIARAEEVHLSRLYGAKYERYRRAVPALFPWRPYPGPRYGIRSEFKLQKGREWFKVLGYLAGILGILLVKRIRPLATLPILRPLPTLSWFLGTAFAAVAVVFRPKTRSSWLRACQTVLSTVAVLFLALHVPGVWPPARPLPASVGSLAPTSPTPVFPEQDSFKVVQRAQEQVDIPEVNPIRPASVSPHPHGFFSGVGRFLWDHLDVVGGACALGIAAAVEDERKEHQGKEFRMEDFNKIGPIALGVAAVLGLWKQRHGSSALSLAPSSEDPWRFQVRPVPDQGRVTVIATFKRRF